MLVAHSTARLLELRPGLSVIKDGGGGDDGGGDDGDWMEMSADAKPLHARAAVARPSCVRLMGT